MKRRRPRMTLRTRWIKASRALTDAKRGEQSAWDALQKGIAKAAAADARARLWAALRCGPPCMDV